MPVRSIYAALLIGAAAAPAVAQTAPDLVAKNLEARGGAAAIAAIKGLIFDGRTIFPGDFEVTYKEWRAQDGPRARDRVTYSLQGLDVIQAYDGSGAWKINPLQGRKDAERMSADEARQLADASTITGPLLQARTDGSTVTYLGLEDFDGTDAYKLKVAQKDGDQFVYWLDPDTFLEIKIEETRRIRGAQQVTETELGDYEKIAGVYFPMSVESWAQGHPNERSRKIIAPGVANPVLDDSLFDEPGQHAAAIKAAAPDASDKTPAKAGKADPAQPSNPPKGN